MATEILVDSNHAEREIGQRLQTLLPKADVRFERLDVADFVIRANGRTLYIERKSLSDLAGSIASGRIEEQGEARSK